MMKVYPLILAGGGGQRLWPLSTPTMPKPFHTLLGDGSLFQQTVRRLEGFCPIDRIHVGCGVSHQALVAHQLRALNINPEGRILTEPIGRNTGPAILLAAFHAAQQHPDTVMLVLPADHVIPDEAAFCHALTAARAAAERNFLVMMGLKPTRAETGYGYMETEEQGVMLEPVAVRRFVEKPCREDAERYVSNPAYLWNAGIFAFKAEVIIEEFRTFQPLIFDRVQAFIAGEEDAYAACPNLSIDYAVMEHSERALVLPVSFDWDDAGTWQAIHGLSTKDELGNATEGHVSLIDSSHCHFRASERTLIGIGLENLLVVETPNEVLIADIRANDAIRQVARRQTPATTPNVDYRPWGSFTVIESRPGCLTKRIDIHPGGRTSLQKHDHRSEHWVVTAGQIRVVKDEQTLTLGPGQSIDIPVGTVHRLENPGPEPASLIEVQTGPLLSEDDIVRLDDDYGRQTQDLKNPVSQSE